MTTVVSNDKSRFDVESAARLEWKSFLWLDKRGQKDWERKADKAAQIILIMTRLRKLKNSGSFFMLVGDNS